ncbi:unnamed protein product [Nesidiocoris tenuis]|uniref:Serine/threonine-protein phosphatase n=1 Tax=Nesidiocoris tenuis TaxID=355587 RepID=A0A6H5G502_9HEMI|nr:unnamed protein product [Nesidiocoris tenuis]
MKAATCDVEGHIEKLMRCEKLKESQVKDLCSKAKEIISKEANLLILSTPITICGDIHGQLPDLVELFSVGGAIPWSTYLFLGDYVDRGYNSIETYLLLLALKVRYPNRIFLLRGNHESREITQVYGFYDEVLRKYGSITVWKYCVETFNVLSLAALIDSKVFCVHGGLSPTIEVFDDIKALERYQDVPHSGAMTDLLWSDPDEQAGWGMSPRGAGYIYGPDVVDRFMVQNNIAFIARAHQLVLEGFKWHFGNKVITVWSAPNYCYRCGNVASILEVESYSEYFATIFDAAPQVRLLLR